MKKRGWSGLWIVVLLVLLPVNSAHSFVPALAGPMPHASPGVAAPLRYAAPSASLQSATFQITWSASCATPPDGAKAALLAAAAAWGERLSSPVEISVQACWTSPTPCYEIACGKTERYLFNFSNAPQVDTAYPVALANALSGQDSNGEQTEIYVYFDSAQSWSFVTDPPGNFMVDAMHELAHGLGFVGHMYESYNIGFCGDGQYGALYPCPTIYDRFVVDSTGISLLSYKKPDPRVLGAKLKSDANFSGPNLLFHNASLPIRLYTPSTFVMGSSLSHLDMSYAFTPDGLMTPDGSGGLPGPLTLAMLHDIGWAMADGSPNLRTAGPLALGKGQAGNFSADLDWPAYAGQPITYTWSLPGGETQVHSGRGITDTLSWSWTDAGFKAVWVTASGPFQSSSTTHAVLALDIGLDGPTQGDTGAAYTFSATLTPVTGLPVTYHWQASNLGEVIHTNMGSTDTATFTWPNHGTKTVIVTASLGGGLVTTQQSVQISGPDQPQFLFLPIVIRH